VTTDFVYLRLHGASALYVSSYTDEELRWWGARIDAWRVGREPNDACRITDLEPPGRDGRDIYVYFDNDVAASAPHDALRLTRILLG